MAARLYAVGFISRIMGVMALRSNPPLGGAERAWPDNERDRTARTNPASVKAHVGRLARAG